MSDSMIYFDNAATSFPKAPGVNEAMCKFLAEDAANPGRAGHRMAVAADDMIKSVRLKLSRLFDAENHNTMVFTLNGTDALNIAIKGVLGDGEGTDGTHVITTDLEHNSVSRPLQAMADRKQIELTRVTFDDDGFIDPEDVRKAIRPSTRLIVMTHASNVLGTIQDAAAVGAIAREHDVLFCLDAAQTAGVLPVSIKELNVDLLAFPGHKSLLGPTGTGALYVGERCPPPVPPPDMGASSAVDDAVKRFSPWREGGTGGDSATPTQPAEFPHYLEGGTPNTVGIAGLGAGVDFVNQQGIGKALAHEQQMVQTLIDRFADDDRFTVYGTRDAKRRVGTVSLNINDHDAPNVGSILDVDFQIAVRPGLHCAPYTHRRLGTFPDGAVRISPGAFNTDDELNQLIEALDQLAEAFV